MHSDDRITKEVRVAIKKSGLIDATDIEIKVKKGIVNFSGKVHSLNEKNLISELTRSHGDVLEVRNQLKVDDINADLNGPTGVLIKDLGVGHY